MSKETLRVYRIYRGDLTEKELDLDINSISDDKFMEIAERQGYVWGSPKEFAQAFNRDGCISSDTDYIRFIKPTTV